MVVSSVDAGSQASEQGVHVGDVVVEVNSQPTAGKDKAGVMAMVKVAGRPLTMRLSGRASMAAERI